MIEFPKPRNYPYKEVFYSDGSIAMMYGTYKNGKHRTVGLRWTEAESPLGYPNVRGQGMWMVLPDKLAQYILKGIKEEKAQHEFILCPEEFETALAEVGERANGE